MSAKRRSKRQRRKQLIGALVMLAVLLLGYFFPELFEEEAPAARPAASAMAELPAGDELHFIDVGQGDASLILSDGEAVLIDGGTGSAEDDLLAYLESLGIDRLRAVIATHPHEDHIGGLDVVLESIPTDEVFMPDREAGTACFDRMMDAIEAQDIPVTIPEPGDTLDFGSDASLEFLSPDPDASYSDTNDYSIVTRLTIGGVHVLYMGDAETPVEDELCAAGFDLSCDIIKLGHHGSSTSSSEAFLQLASPSIAVISCAKENDYGHPHKETLDKLAKYGIEARYTYDGTIVFAGEAA